jgi:CHAD domain-containing protein
MEEIDWAVGQLTRSKDREKAVHEARKSLKKIRGLLGLLAEPLGRLYKTEDRYFRNVGQQLSQLRDNAVMLETFDALAARHQELDPIALANIRRNLLRSQGEAAAEKQVSAEVSQALAAARAKAVAWRLDHLQFPALVERRTKKRSANRPPNRFTISESR